jgi:hypothetical protein
MIAKCTPSGPPQVTRQDAVEFSPARNCRPESVAQLRPSAQGKRVQFSGRNRTVIDGPFETNQLVAAFWLWQVRSMEEAVEWVKRCPNPMPEDSQIEICPAVTWY